MTPNQATVTAYMEAFTRTDRPAILGCLTEDVEWLVPGAFHVYGKAAFDSHILEAGSAPNPAIVVTRLIEESDLVVAEGTVRAGMTDGTAVNLVFCDVFEMRGAKIRKLISYLMPVA